MHYSDLSPFSSVDQILGDRHAKNVGWLSKDHEFRTEAPEPSFLDALRSFCSHPIIEHRGYHRCEFCRPSIDEQIMANWDGSSMKLGSKIICVFGGDTTVYLSPDLIFHYVKVHHYAPPEEFVTAVVSGPQPGTAEYARLVRPYTDGFAVEARANEAARTAASRFGYFLDCNNKAQPMPDEALEDKPGLSLEEIALDLRLKSYLADKSV